MNPPRRCSAAESADRVALPVSGVPRSSARTTVGPVFVLIALGGLLLGFGGLDSLTDRTVPVLFGRSPSADAELWFTEVSETVGLADFRHESGARGERLMPETTGGGGGFIDYDGDGWQDVLLVGGGRLEEDPARDPAYDSSGGVPAVRLYRNLGDGTFTDRTREAGLAGYRAYGMGVTVADYDGDGDADFYLSALRENLLFRNDDGRFVEVAREAGVAGPSEWSTAALFFDPDRDEDLDLFVGGYVEWPLGERPWCTVDGGRKAYCPPTDYPGIGSRFYRNRGDGTFGDATDETGLGVGPGRSFGAAEMDFNRDGWPDLVVANDMSPNLLFVNQGGRRFREWASIGGVAVGPTGHPRAGMGVDVGVVDPTGEETVFVGNFSGETAAVFQHAGGGLFLDRAISSGIDAVTTATLTFGLFLFDADLDGALDLFLANGHVQPDIDLVDDGITYAQPAQLLRNDGSGRFTGVEAGDLTRTPMVARGAAYADYDRDGDLDVLVVENGGPARLFRNEIGAGRGAVRVKLAGPPGNGVGLGARVTAFANGAAMARRVRTGSSYLSASETVLTFGLSGAEEIDSLHVRWPDGQVDRIGSQPAGRTITVAEGGEIKDLLIRDAIPHL